MFVIQQQNGAPLTSPGPTGYSPSQMAQAYGFNQIQFGSIQGDGTGQTIAIVDAYDDPTIASDLRTFDQAFGLPNPVFTKVNQNGGSTMPSANSGWAEETSLDVEWAHAIAPGANILLVEANSNSDSDLYTAVQYAAGQPGVAAVSMSWGGGEYSGETGSDSVFTTPSGHSGVVFIASSGDSGAPPIYPSVSPNVLAVGGTSLFLNGSSYSSESAWSGSGGGISSYETQPSYQQGVVTQSTTRRTSPDVAYDADPNTGVPVIDTYSFGSADPWAQFGGTSAAAPQWAALVAIADQGRALNNKSALDGPSQLLPMIYQMPSSDFHDITTGTTTGTPNYSAGPGYDLTTGRGTPVANQVVSYLVGLSPVSGLTATAASSSQINLSWNAYTGATSYQIDRSANGTTGWTQVGTTGAGVTTFSDTGLTPELTYYYEIVAVTSGGNSAPSNVASATTQSLPMTVLYSDTFSGSTLNPAWTLYGGSWSVGNGQLSQTSTANGDPRKAMLTNQTYPANTEITALVRVNSWTDGDYARAGVGLYTDPSTGRGYNLVFHNTHGSQGVVQFLDDRVTWGNSYSFAWNPGTAYWFKLEMYNGTLYGKVWQQGTTEPTAWMFQQSGWTDRSSSGAPALNGGSTYSGYGSSTASFTDVTVSTPSAVPSAPTGLTATAASSSQINLSWNAVTGASNGYVIDRSLTGSSGWTQVGTTAAGVTTFSDTGLSASTTYYYEVLAANSAGDSAPSNVASATTQAGSGSVLFSDTFPGSSLSSAWTLYGGTWSVANNTLSQTSTADADPVKAIVTSQTFPANVEITALVTVNSWSDGDYARAGVGLSTDPNSGQGYNLVFHNTHGSQGVVQFLDDGVTWGNSYAFAWNPGTSYWFKLEVYNGTLYGKVWQQGATEPTAWMFEQDGWTDRSSSGGPSLNGSSASSGQGYATVSFQDVTVSNATAPALQTTAVPSSPITRTVTAGGGASGTGNVGTGGTRTAISNALFGENFSQVSLDSSWTLYGRSGGGLTGTPTQTNAVPGQALGTQPASPFSAALTGLVSGDGDTNSLSEGSSNPVSHNTEDQAEGITGDA